MLPKDLKLLKVGDYIEFWYGSAFRAGKISYYEDAFNGFEINNKPSEYFVSAYATNITKISKKKFCYYQLRGIT